ncbi:MAG TPA: GAF domain-containing protein [Puia sp.]
MTNSPENQHRQLLEMMDEGFIGAEVISDSTGAIVDWRFIDANKAMQKHLGMAPSSLIGQLGSTVFPQEIVWWRNVVGQVIDTQQSAHLQQYFEDSDAWFGITMFPFGPGRFAVLYYDITDKRRREANAAFLDCVTTELATLSTPEEIMQTVGAMIGEYLHVSSCSFVDIDEEAGEVTIQHNWQLKDTPTLRQTFRLNEYLNEDYARASRAGQTVVVTDTTKDSRSDPAAYAQLNIGALVTIPFIRQGRWIASTCITSLKPRQWREEELTILQATSNRLFSRVEHSRAEQAVRRSEQKYRTLFESIDEGFCFIQLIYDETGAPVDWTYLEANPNFVRQSGFDAVGKNIREVVPDIEPSWFHFYHEVATTRNPGRREGPVSAIGRWFSVSAAPVAGSVDIVAVVFIDITQRKLAETSLLEKEQQLQALQQQRDELLARLARWES